MTDNVGDKDGKETDDAASPRRGRRNREASDTGDNNEDEEDSERGYQARVIATIRAVPRDDEEQPK